MQIFQKKKKMGQNLPLNQPPTPEPQTLNDKIKI